MRHLVLLRHAKAEGEAPNGGGDFDRRLAPRGLRQLEALPALFQACKAPPTLVIASPAARTRATAEGLVAAFPQWRCELRFDMGLYQASADGILALLASLPEADRSVCIVAHNPGVAELAERLAGRSVPMPTLGSVGLASAAKHWRELGPKTTSLAWSAVPNV